MMASCRRDALMNIVALIASVALLGAYSFVPARMTGALRGTPPSGAARGQRPMQTHEGESATAVLAFATAAGAAAALLSKRQKNKIARQYTTDKILPNMVWQSAGFGAGDLETGEIRTVTLAGLDIAIGK